MNHLHLANRARRNLKQNKARTILTALAIAVGATTICLALAAGNGGKAYINRQMEDRGINPRDIHVHALGSDPTTGAPDEICAPDLAELEKLESIEQVITSDSNSSSISSNCFFSITVRARHENQAAIESTMAAIQDTLAPKSLSVYSEWDLRASTMQAINVAQWGLIGFGALAILASIFGIINTQYISVLERTREIGLMRALGARRRDIARLFRYEAAWIGLLGSLIGVTIAFLITLANPLITNFLNLEPSVRLLKINPFQVLILIASLILVATLSGWLPARRAAKLDPIAALRSE